MTLDEIKQELHNPAYDFLKNNPHLGDKIILLGLGGSHAYGTFNEHSDLDIRGIALNSDTEILLGKDFGQVDGQPGTDVCICSFNKIIRLMANCNPNYIELLGLKPEHYLYISPIGQKLLENKDMFLSKKAFHTFSGYSHDQTYRMNQIAKDGFAQSDLEIHILKTLERMRSTFPEKYQDFDGYLNLYIDDSKQEDMDTEIFMDVNLKHYPLRDYCKLWNEWQTTVSSYRKLGKRNDHALKHEKLGKHQMQIVRLMDTCYDILANHEINTYRENERDEYIAIRNGKYITDDNLVKPEFFELVAEKDERNKEAYRTSTLPDNPDWDKINAFIADVNRKIINHEI